MDIINFLHRRYIFEWKQEMFFRFFVSSILNGNVYFWFVLFSPTYTLILTKTQNIDFWHSFFGTEYSFVFLCFFFFFRSRILFVAYTFEKVNKRCVIIILSFSWCISRWTWMRCRIRCHTNILFTRWHFGGFNAFWKQLWNVIVFDGRQYHAGLAGLWW